MTLKFRKVEIVDGEIYSRSFKVLKISDKIVYMLEQPNQSSSIALV